MIKELLTYFKQYKHYPILSFITMMLEVLCEVSQPLLMLRIIDEGIPNRDLGMIFMQGAWMIGLAFISLGLGLLSARFATIGGTGLATNLRRKEMEKIQEFSFHNLDSFSNASLITRLTSDITSVQNTTIMSVRLLARAPLMFIFALFFAVRINPQLSLVFFVAIPILGLFLAWIIALAYPRFLKVQKATDGLNKALQENFIGIRVVKSFVREEFEKEKFFEKNRSYKERALRAFKIVIFNNPVMQATIYSCTIAVMWFGGKMVMFGSMTTGEFISFISYINQILFSLMMISFVFIMVTMTKASLSRIFEVIHTPIDIVEGMYQTPSQSSLDLVVENVHFSYAKDPQEEVLRNIQVTVKEGTTLGIIGSTGSGKTSFIQLISRLYDPTEGRITYGGTDLKDWKFEELRQHISVVLQKNTLFSGTIRENLLWGNEYATDAELIQAATYAQAHNFIMSFPNGYDTVLDQGGNNLSGGQKQRLCIARALVRKPSLLILDDSTSAVDTATDASIREALYTKFKHTTKIIIAQRVSSVQHADQIMVLEDGEVNGLGSHEELLQSNELYREIFETQTKGVNQYESSNE